MRLSLCTQARNLHKCRNGDRWQHAQQEFVIVLHGAECDYYTAARVNTWGKPYLDSSDISNITVKDLLRFTTKTGRFSALNSSQQ